MKPNLPIANQPDPSPDEQQLIAFHLGELHEPGSERAGRARLEQDPAFAALSEEIAHTLRVFSAEPVPAPDTEAAWQRLRPTLPPHDAPLHQHRVAHISLKQHWLRPAFAIALALSVVAAFTATLHHRSAKRPQVDEASAIHLGPQLGTGRSSGEADHLDRAERWLTEVNHTTEPLDSETRAEGRQLLTTNALYLQSARTRGDLPDAAVLDRLNRVLTTSNHPSEAGLQLRVQMNTDGLLFELRILRQNQTALNGDPQ